MVPIRGWGCSRRGLRLFPQRVEIVLTNRIEIVHTEMEIVHT